MVEDVHARALPLWHYRHPQYYADSAREKLRERIISELLSNERLDDDDKVRLGKGGLLPKGPILKEKKFFLVTGLPASGKSSIANKIADGSGSIIIDSDFAKRKFAEFDTDYGAALVHDEAWLITEGPISDGSYKGLSVLEIVISQDFNVVMPKICQDEKGSELYLNISRTLIISAILYMSDLIERRRLEELLTDSLSQKDMFL